MPQLHIFEGSDFPAHLNWQAVSFMRVQWASIFSGANAFSTETYPATRQPTHFALTEGDMLISYAAVMRLELDHAHQRYRVAAFGNVFTFPSLRGKGYGRQVVDAASAYLSRRGMDVAILFCDPDLAPFYARSGWQACDRAETRIGTQRSTTPIAICG